ncbi:hypothetical protein [Parageobacillus thermantarcticus]|uniref:hypothetical protein n=1 Tax=Parageobacillus thermantarcticus TaxID=186116 RepID=UPI000B81422E|nr:hypothetical protein [Parageobacillus thermantarcticus]
MYVFWPSPNDGVKFHCQYSKLGLRENKIAFYRFVFAQFHGLDPFLYYNMKRLAYSNIYLKERYMMGSCLIYVPALAMMVRYWNAYSWLRKARGSDIPHDGNGESYLDERDSDECIKR